MPAMVTGDGLVTGPPPNRTSSSTWENPPLLPVPGMSRPPLGQPGGEVRSAAPRHGATS